MDREQFDEEEWAAIEEKFRNANYSAVLKHFEVVQDVSHVDEAEACLWIDSTEMDQGLEPAHDLAERIADAGIRGVHFDMTRCSLEIGLGRGEEAIERIANDYPAADLTALEVEQAYKQGHFQEAIAIARRGLDFLVEPYERIEVISTVFHAHLQLGDMESARAYIEKAFQNDEQSWAPQMAFVKLRDKRVAEAKELLEEAQARHPSDARLLYGLACCSFVLRNYVVARDQIDAYISENRASFHGWHLKAQIYYKLRDFKASEVAATEALRFNPTDYDSAVSLVRALLRQGKLREGRLAMKRAVATESEKFWMKRGKRKRM
ncbi:MAG: tetratricopeptide repeat protein [Fimbriimonadaceae bacterium]